jgi:hypothetical protein
MNQIDVIAKIIPILIVFFLTVYSNQTIEFSQTILGRFISIGLIVFYINYNLLYGIFACLLVIFYYQCDCVDSLNDVNIVDLEGFTEDKNDKKNAAEPPENFANYNETYPDLDTTKPSHEQNLYKPIQKNSSIKEVFRKKNCKKGALKFKDIDVKHEIATHIFPEIKFNNDACNPCTDTCNFSIIEEKMKNEDSIVKPKFSNNAIFPLSTAVITELSPAIGVVSEPFSSYTKI